MFDSLGRKLSAIFDKLKGRGVITDDDFALAMREIRIALLEADVALPVIKEFIDNVRKDAIGKEVIKSISPGQMIVKIVHDNIVSILSHDNCNKWNLSKRPSVILMAGLQGSGKTTMIAKLGHLFKKDGKRVLLASCDIYRPAAMEQLCMLGSKAGIDVLDPSNGEKVPEIAARAMAKAREYDILIIDTAGRMHVDDDMMSEIVALKDQTMPQEILFVADSLSGQDIFNTAKAFNDALSITGICLSRVDGDGRGGAALSVRYVTGCPIKALGTGERFDQIEYFDPKRIADRILDMGDVVSLVEQTASNMSEEEMMPSFARMQKGLFDMNDFLSHMQKMEKMGGLSSLMSFIPGMRAIKDKIGDKIDKVSLKKPRAIIQSMTKKERRQPEILNASRRKRIANGSGTTVADVNKVVQQFGEMQKMAKHMSKNFHRMK